MISSVVPSSRLSTIPVSCTWAISLDLPSSNKSASFFLGRSYGCNLFMFAPDGLFLNATAAVVPASGPVNPGGDALGGARQVYTRRATPGEPVGSAAHRPFWVDRPLRRLTTLLRFTVELKPRISYLWGHWPYWVCMGGWQGPNWAILMPWFGWYGEC